ncbi:MAG: PhzF family phenazine biosynthesis protein, partial [Anaerolineae bacterium]|nr:PhzF family phenazine biosynthesis protein [Anaerolineae bacterium]
IPEDPATGSASGPLGCYLVRHDLVTPAQARHIISEQGVEMGRPSLIHIHIGTANGELSSVEVGGTCVLMGEGRLMIADAADFPGGQPAADD